MIGRILCAGVGALVSATSVLGMASSVYAADLYKHDGGGLKDEPYAPAHLWSGAYLGANVGYAWGDYEISGTNGAFNERVPDTLKYDTNGALAGAQFGYNWQRGSYVFGFEAEAGYLGAEGDVLVGDDFSDTEFGAYGVLAARLGIASDRALYYVKGGLALAGAETNAGDLIGESEEGGVPQETKLDEALFGYAVGGGVEYAVNGNWAVKVEYLYMNFGEEKSADLRGGQYTHDVDLHTAKIGVNYRLGGDYDSLK